MIKGIDASTALVRDVLDSDMETITRIYTDQVQNGVSSWEEDPPSCAEMTRRQNTLVAAGYPYRVALLNDVVVGYCYASA